MSAINLQSLATEVNRAICILSSKTRRLVQTLFASFAFWVASIINFAASSHTAKSEPFKIGVYMCGADEPGLHYYSDPLGTTPRDYIRRAFKEIKELGFDFVNLNHVDPKSFPWILKEAEMAGLEFLFQGIGFPSYYEHQDGYEEFLPEHAPGSQNLVQRQERRARMRTEMLPFLCQWVPMFANEKALIGWTITEEIPRDPMIYSDLAEITHAIHAMDKKHKVAIEFHWLEALEECVAAVKPDIVACGAAFTINSEFRSINNRSDWWFFGDYGTDVFLKRAFQAAKKNHGELWVVGSADALEVRGDTRSSRWKPDGGGSNLMPTEGELRAQVWLSIINGATAFEIFSYNSIDDERHAQLARRFRKQPNPSANDHTHRMIGLVDMAGQQTSAAGYIKKIIQEIRSVASLITNLEPTANSPWSYQIPRRPWRIQAFKNHNGGDEYLMIVNADPDNAHTLNFDLRPWSASHTHVRIFGSAWQPVEKFCPVVPPGSGIIIEKNAP